MGPRSLRLRLASLAFLLLGSVPLARAAEDFTLRIGAQFQGWSGDFVEPYNGVELWAPLSLSYRLDKDLRFFLLGKVGTGSYTDSVGATKTQNLADLTDTVLGGVGNFMHFGLPALLDLRVNLPTGDPSWESKQIPASIPTEFIGSRYQGRGFGVSAFYGLSFPEGKSSFGAGLGYLYTEAFVTDEVLSSLSDGLRLGDALFLVLNRIQDLKAGRSDRFRLTGTFFLPTLEGGEEIFHMGPNVNLSYAFLDPKGFSWEAGAQIFTPARRPGGGGLVAEPKNSFGQRLYFVPTLALEDGWAVSGRLKVIFANGYAEGEALYNGGGFLGGLEPSYKLDLGDRSSLKFSASYDRVLHTGGGQGGMDAQYERWVLGTEYQVGF